MQVKHLEATLEGRFLSVFMEFDGLTRLACLTFELNPDMKNVKLADVEDAVADCFYLTRYHQTHQVVIHDDETPIDWLGKMIDKVDACVDGVSV